jgi:hypothetical protein
MAAITFKTENRKEQLRKQIETALAAYREMLDTFVSNRVRQAATAAERARPRRAPDTTPPVKSAMTAMMVTCNNPPPRQAPGSPASVTGRESARSGMGPAAAPGAISTLFVPLDPGIVNETIPAFFIGRNMEGFWVARDVNGQIGGIFLFENSALLFATRHSRPAGCATIFPSERFELDLENKGNPLAAQLGSLKRFARRVLQRMAAFIGKAAEAGKHKLKDF